MADDDTRVTGEPEPGTHCEWCGADYERQDPQRARGRQAAPPSAPLTVSEGEPATHCEWCGAEYPLPGEGRERV